MPAKSTKAAPKKSSAATASKSALATNAKAVNAAAVPEPTRLAKRGRAESILEIDEATFKRAKGDTGVSGTAGAELAQSEPAKPPKLDEETKKKLIALRFLLVEQNKRSMEAVMDAIAYEYIRPNSVEEMIEAVLDALKTRALSGKSIGKDAAAIEYVDKKRALGDYDEVEPEGLSKAVQNRLDEIEGMVEGLSKRFLKDVFKGIGDWGSGTNRDMAARIVEILESRARDEGSDLSHEYKVVTRVHNSCWGGCGESDGEEGEGW